MEKEFTDWFEANEKRFAHGQFDEKQIAYSAWIEGRKTVKNNAVLPHVSGSALDVAKQIPQVPQTQMALNEQLKILRIAANRLGLYDAAGFIRRD
jgi:hypothetical protein